MAVGLRKIVENARVGAEGVATFDLSGEPSVAKVLARAALTPAPHLFPEDLGARANEHSGPGVEADTLHHRQPAPGRCGCLARLKPQKNEDSHGHHD